jgi:ribosome-associated protein
VTLTGTFKRAEPEGLAEEVIVLSMNSEQVTALAVSSLEELKGIDIVILDIIGKSSIADAMLVATGTSQRHVRSLATSVRMAMKEAGHPPLGVEGGDTSDWVLVDLGDVIVHVMTQEKRDFYAIEKLWSVGPDDDEQRPGILSSV